ncbi:hypothetical protein H5410_056377 [Solanum commersonii]|uniref:Uncharacterized protein n=1 Tax=Solanum commersonii TaxID=4109 RepID=A0A9J5WK36_SOLCO|nr:hypothetical protein H5410_056377 [Solanum commersonii]
MELSDKSSSWWSSKHKRERFLGHGLVFCIQRSVVLSDNGLHACVKALKLETISLMNCFECHKVTHIELSRLLGRNDEGIRVKFQTLASCSMFPNAESLIATSTSVLCIAPFVSFHCPDLRGLKIQHCPNISYTTVRFAFMSDKSLPFDATLVEILNSCWVHDISKFRIIDCNFNKGCIAPFVNPPIVYTVPICYLRNLSRNFKLLLVAQCFQKLNHRLQHQEVLPFLNDLGHYLQGLKIQHCPKFSSSTVDVLVEKL